MGKSEIEAVGVLEPGMHEGGQFGARHRKSSASRLISVGPAGYRQPTVVEASGMRERGYLKPKDLEHDLHKGGGCK